MTVLLHATYTCMLYARMANYRPSENTKCKFLPFLAWHHKTLTTGKNLIMEWNGILALNISDTLIIVYEGNKIS